MECEIMVFVVICFLIYIIAFSCIIIMAIRMPSEFKGAVDSIIDDLLKTFGIT